MEEDKNKIDYGFCIKSWPDTLQFSQLEEDEEEEFFLLQLKDKIVEPLDFQ